MFVPDELIRRIRDQFGDDKCWMDWHALFALLPEGYTPPKQDTAVEIKHCQRYLQCRVDGTEYIPPARWVVGPPDRPGWWVIIYTDGTKNFIRVRNVGFECPSFVRSFGPIPEEP